MSDGWISVKERLPDKDGYYLTLSYTNRCHVSRFWRLSRWRTREGDEPCFPSGVTHWMPLPLPPKESE